MFDADEPVTDQDRFEQSYCIDCRKPIRREFSDAHDGRCAACDKIAASAPPSPTPGSTGSGKPDAKAILEWVKEVRTLSKGVISLADAQASAVAAINVGVSPADFVSGRLKAGPAPASTNGSAACGCILLGLLAIFGAGAAFSGFSCSGENVPPIIRNAGASAQELREKVRMGMTYDEVRSALGPPERVQKLEGETPVGDRTIKTDMQFWYYKVASMEFGGAGLQIGFDEGRVTSINQL